MWNINIAIVKRPLNVVASESAIKDDTAIGCKKACEFKTTTDSHTIQSDSMVTFSFASCITFDFI